MEQPEETSVFWGDTKEQRTVVSGIRALAHGLEPVKAISIATGYFNANGLARLRAFFGEEDIPIRILLGSEPNVSPNFKPDGDEPFLAFNRESYSCAYALYSWLQSPLSEVRLLAEPFLHSKVIWVEGETRSGVSVGSANLTGAGFLRNLEATITSQEGVLLAGVEKWYEEMWANGTSGIQSELLASLSALLGLADPEIVYLKILQTVLDGLDRADVSRESGWLDPLTPFQEDGAIRALNRLLRHRGALIADEVGLGKTWMGLAIAERYLAEGGNVLILAPPAVVPGWDEEIQNRGLSRRLRVTTYGTVQTQVLCDAAYLDGLRLLILDEAHLIRSERSAKARMKSEKRSRREAVLEVLGQAAGRVDTLMLTATPVNNSLRDLGNLLKVFVPDDHLQGVGISSLASEFRDADRSPDTYHWSRITLLLNDLMVRRTRQYIRATYGEPDGTLRGRDGQEWRLPHLLSPIPLRSYPNSEALAFQEEIATALVSGPLSLAAYRLGEYGDDPAQQSPPIHLLYTTLLKRWESSPSAFMATCQTFLHRTESVRAGLLQSSSGIASNTLNWADFAELLEGDSEEEFESEAIGDTYRLRTSPLTSSERDRLAAELETDSKILRDWVARAEKLTLAARDNPKVRLLVDLIESLAIDHPGHTEEDRNRRKVLVFTQYRDTAEWVTRALNDILETDLVSENAKGCYRGRIAGLTGDTDAKTRDEILAGFAPATHKTSRKALSKGDLWDVLVATDALSEGVNLQQACRVVSFDLPWNPAKLVQRAGRVDRLHSSHNEVYSYLFLPPSSDQFRKLLRLEAHLRAKALKARRSTGMTDVGLIQDGEPDKIYDDALDDEEEERLRQIDALEKGRWPEGLTRDLEALRARMAKAESDPQVVARLNSLPMPAGAALSSGLVDTPTFVFCLMPESASESPLIIVARDSDSEYRAEADLPRGLLLADPAQLTSVAKNPEILWEDLFQAWMRAQEWILKRLTESDQKRKLPIWASEALSLDEHDEQNLTERSRSRAAAVHAALRRPLSQSDEEALKRLVETTEPRHIIDQLHRFLGTRGLLRGRASGVPDLPLAWMQVTPKIA